MNAASWNGLEDLRMLLDRGADPRLRNSSGETALDVADVNGSSAAVKDLLRAAMAGERAE